MRRSQPMLLAFIAAAVALLAGANRATAQSTPLTGRLPQAANAAMSIDVTRILQSPLARKQDLQSKLISGYADRPLAIPGTARQVAIAAAVDPTGLESVWQVALIDLPNAPR